LQDFLHIPSFFSVLDALDIPKMTFLPQFVFNLGFWKVCTEPFGVKIAKEKFIMGFEHGYNKNAEIEALILEQFPNALVIHKKDMQGKDRMTFAIVGDFNE
jgi:hypothetical protein